ncbi:FAD-binding protein [Ornithinimicrobium sp. Arc0846-15]|nr:FAD-binding protein [Ornithinimicrobium laminariae]
MARFTESQDAQVLQDLAAQLTQGRLVSSAASMAGHSRDFADWAESGAPVAVVIVAHAHEVQAVVQVCVAHGRPVVARGAGTGLAGAANAEDGWVVIAFEEMNRIVEVNSLERYAVVQPGVINDDLRRAAAGKGLWYPPDPVSSAWSTIGGNVATNAGGLCCVKYGVTGDYVLELEVVTGTGDLVRVGRRTAKGVAGYDLASLLVGSEGTLGIITEVTLRLRPSPKPARAIVGFFPSVESAGEAVRAVAEAGITPSTFELMDRHVIAAVEAMTPIGVDQGVAALLLAKIDDAGVEGDETALAVATYFGESGATWADQSSDPAEAEALFAARRLSHTALERLGTVLSEDVCVPKSALPAMLVAVEVIAEKHDILIATVAHAGDGNLHPLLITPPGDQAARARAQVAFAELMTQAIALGGTITGEHGIGLLKRDGLLEELSDPVVSLHRQIKNALDPAGILNPGKVLGPDEVDSPA